MPRTWLLISRLGQAAEPGITETTVRLGAILPPEADGTTSRVIRHALLDYFTRVNGTGGIFGRRIELSFKELPVNPLQRAAAIREFLIQEQIFAVVCGAFTGAETEFAAVLRETGIPAIGTFAPFPPGGSPLKPYVFYLDGGAREEVDTLFDFAAERFTGRNIHPAMLLRTRKIPAKPPNGSKTGWRSPATGG
jgi:ABC-type branched-subunit amino acid transport system substrate-binding protein